jgi:hypothetical protein
MLQSAGHVPHPARHRHGQGDKGQGDTQDRSKERSADLKDLRRRGRPERVLLGPEAVARAGARAPRAPRPLRSACV